MPDASESEIGWKVVEELSIDAAKLLEPGRIEGVTGVNVPMLLRVITYRERSIEVLVKKAVAGACEGVVHMK